MKKRGFTLVEVLAMLTVIGIIMVVSIPNISGMLRNQRLSYLKGDANSMVEAAKTKVSKNQSIEKPKTGQCIIFTLNYLDDENEMVKGPNGGLYDQFDSVVVYTKVEEPQADGTVLKKYKYYVRLVENYDDKRIGFEITDSDDIDSKTSNDVKDIGDNIGLTKESTLDGKDGVRELIRKFGSINSHCIVPDGEDYEMVLAYYPGV